MVLLERETEPTLSSFLNLKHNKLVRLKMLALPTLMSAALLGLTGCWAKSVGGTGADSVQHMAVDAAGNSIVIGRFTKTFTIGGTTLVPDAAGSAFIAKYDSNGS